MKINQAVQEMHRNYSEECDEAVKSLIELTGIDTDVGTVKEAMQKLKEKGFSIKMFSDGVSVLNTYFALHHGKDFVAGSVVQLNFELNQIKRTLLPHFDELDEKFQGFIKGVSTIEK